MRSLFAGLMALALGTGAWAAEPEALFPSKSMEASVSADRIAFVSNRGGVFEVYTADRDGSDLRQLTSDGAPKDTPTFSPDGRLIAYTVASNGQEDIWVMDRDGKSPRRLTDDSGNDIHPNWSSSGERLVFTRVIRRPGTDEYRLGLWTMNADGTRQYPLTQGANASYGSWSPDGGSLVFWREFSGQGEIVVTDAGGSNERRLTNNPAFDGWPQWRPDGKAIVFVRVQEDRLSDLWLLDLESGRETRLTSGPGRKTSPKWTPDGRHILFDRSLDGELGIWRVAAP